MTLVARHSISIVFPAYNEETNISVAVEQVVNFLEPLFPDWEVVVVNDGSRDGTGAVIDELARRLPRVVAVHHAHNRGYGTALRSGIMAASKDLVFFSDSDLQFHLGELLLLLTWIEQYDIVIGYRSRRRDPFYRKVNAWGWKTLVRLLLGLRVRDIDCAFKLFRRHVFQAISIESVGAMVNTEILVKAHRMGLKLKQIPVTHFPRRAGVPSGANVRVIVKAFRELFRLYLTLRQTPVVFVPYERRQVPGRGPAAERRRGERRRVMLPINFVDRRQRAVLLPALQPPAPAEASGAPAPARSIGRGRAASAANGGDPDRRREPAPPRAGQKRRAASGR